MGSVPGLRRSPGERNGNPFQYSYLGNTMDRGACWATVQLVKKESDMTSWLKNDNTWQIMPKKDMIKYYTYTLNNRIQICINFNLTVIEIYSCVHALLSESCSAMSNSLWPHGLYSTWNSRGQNTPGKISFLQGIFPTQGSNPGLPALQADFLPAELQEKPKNTRVGSLPLLQWIFLTQESNRGLLHCRQILYQPSYQGSLHALLNWSQKNVSI